MAPIWKRRRLRPLLSLDRGHRYQFPPTFLFGAGTASHQAEGMDKASDWWRFERRRGRARQFSNFPAFAQEWKSDHWRRYSSDIALMRDELGLSGYRFTVDWSRVEPVEGEFDFEAIDRYGAICRELKAAGITPVVTLFHWSSPDWIWDHSHEWDTGWYDPRIVERFARFCTAVVPALDADIFCTLNEPNIFLYGGFSDGMLAPGHHAHDEALAKVLQNLLRCHVVAWKAIKEHSPTASVGIAHQFQPFEPESYWNVFDGFLAAQVERAFTWSVPDALVSGEATFTTRTGGLVKLDVEDLRGTADFMGVNYYEREFVRSLPKFEIIHDHNGDKEIWPREIYTRGLDDVLHQVAGYGLPIYVMENGRAHPDDSQRELYMREHVATVGHALEDGIDVRGFFYWSLLDNQEWAHGFLPRFGLFDVDYADGTRRLRGTGRAYAEIARSRSLVY